jgi:2-amino-4-hydroxy-6-hydroxymethyldihydropteridine diphosphokinase
MTGNRPVPVLVGVGSNLDDPVAQVKTAFARLAGLHESTLLACSSLYSSAPLGPQDQPDFCNAVTLIETRLTPVQLLLELQKIEVDRGRVWTRHWGERVIDLDILFFGRQIMQHQYPPLTIPHPHALRRDFVLIPALEICPDWRLPDGSSLSDYAGSCLDHRLRRL